MQAIRVWLSAVVALFLVVSMFHVPLIQMWKKQKASAVPVSTAPAAEPEPEPLVSVTEADTASEATAVEEPEATDTSSDARMVKIGMYPNMHFSLGRFVAQTGERLTVEFENDDPQAQPHTSTLFEILSQPMSLGWLTHMLYLCSLSRDPRGVSRGSRTDEG